MLSVGTTKFVIYAGTAVFTLGWAILLREAVAIIGFVAYLAVLIFVFVFHRPIIRKRLAFTAALSLGVLMAYFSANIAIGTRDLLFDVEPALRPTSHGISHNLFMGLGVKKNPWGIKWDDGATFNDHVKTVNANAIYASHEHYAILRNKYINILMHFLLI